MEKMGDAWNGNRDEHVEIEIEMGLTNTIRRGAKGDNELDVNTSW